MIEVAYKDFSGDFHQTAIQESEAKRLPLEGMIELTRLCSLKCTHCYIGDSRWIKSPDELSTAQMKELLDVLAAKGTLWLCFTGGEAMIRKDFRELWLYAKQKGFILSLFTNATLIDESMAEFLFQNPPLVVEVSIYGATEEIYEAVTLVKGSYKRFMRGVQNLRKAGLPWKMKTVLIKENAVEFEAMKRLAVEWEVAFKFDSNINASIGVGRTGGKAPCASRVEHEESLRAELADMKNVTDLRDTVAADAARSPDAVRVENLYSCGAGQNTFYINADANLQMCVLTGHRGHDLKKGNSIAKAFDSGWDQFAEARRVKRLPNSPCGTCDIATLCENCPGFSHLENGNEQGVVDYLCRSTHLKAAALGVPHRCDIRHFVYSPLKGTISNGQ